MGRAIRYIFEKQQVNERERGADKCESALLKILYYCSKTFVSLHCTLSVPFISLLQLLIALSFCVCFCFDIGKKLLYYSLITPYIITIILSFVVSLVPYIVLPFLLVHVFCENSFAFYVFFV